jgi:uncharacterized RDD family membrane protein YckC
MDDEYTLLTPENVALRYDVAGLGSRVAAAAIDYAILVTGAAILEMGGVFALSLIAPPQLEAPPESTGQLLSGLFAYGFYAVTILITFLVWWGYFVLCEVLWNGQSIGKKRLRLRVIRANGQPVGLVASLVRNVLRVIDLFLMLGALVMLIDRSGRRLGDFAAGTLVIREPAAGKRALLDEVGSVDLPTIPEARVPRCPMSAA